MEIQKPYCIVALPLPIFGLYHYGVPDELLGKDLTGCRIGVTFAGKKRVGFVIAMDASSPIPPDKISYLNSIIDEKAVVDEQMMGIAQWISENYYCSIGEALSCCIPSWTIIPKRKVSQRTNKKQEWNPPALSVDLNEEQSLALNSITKFIGKSHKEFLLYGITGSGKTEVAMRAVSYALENNLSSIILVPEISLTPQMAGWFRSRFGENVAVLHSHLTSAQRRQEWKRIKEGSSRIVVGARSAIFAPVDKLGLVVIDEEQEHSYKQEDIPRYSARDVARYRAKVSHSVVLLCSATPSLETYYKTKKDQVQSLTLSKRVESRPLPIIDVVDMKKELEKGNRSPVLSQYLIMRIEETLSKHQQILLFLNRRGFSTYLFCKKCGFVAKCKRCNVSLVYHNIKKKLICHYCNFNVSVIRICPQCQLDYLQFQGVGTEKVEREITKIFPEARVARMDTDVTKEKGVHSKILEGFASGNIDVLVGTQMIAKGHDFPNVTLVGVISADTTLNLADFRSAERTFHLLIQVSGRAGRGDIPGRVVIQTYNPNHYCLQDIKTNSFDDFYDREIQTRKELFLPPFSKLIQIITKDGKDQRAKDAGDVLCCELETLLRQTGSQIIGPAPMPVLFLKGKYRWAVTIRLPLELWDGVKQKIWECIKRSERSTRVHFYIDVDPVSVL